MQGHGEDEHRRPRKAAVRALRLLRIHVQMRNNVIEDEEKKRPRPEADDGRNKGKLPEIGGSLHRRDEKAPDRCRHHNARSKARQPTLHAAVECILQEENTTGTECRPEKGDHKPLKNI